MKKAQSISINTIIIAAIALAVLVVLFMVFTGRMGNWIKGTDEATNCPQGCKAGGFKDGSPIDETSIGSCSGSSGTILPGYRIIENGVPKKCCCTPS